MKLLDASLDIILLHFMAHLEDMGYIDYVYLKQAKEEVAKFLVDVADETTEQSNVYIRESLYKGQDKREEEEQK